MTIQARKRATNKKPGRKAPRPGTTPADRRILAKAAEEEAEGRPRDRVPDDWTGTLGVFEKGGGPLFRKVAELAKEFVDVPGAPHQAMARILVTAGLAAMHSRTVAEAYSVGGAWLVNIGQESLMARIEMGQAKAAGIV